ncbi:MAG: DUF5069 domain-containing protein [Opitutales bacterium]|nr:DUF5069 domain-containing protein [Opitutales bacterium]NRA28072.1 DUF5069 domain-containing protein [Opitutales bacterium]
MSGYTALSIIESLWKHTVSLYQSGNREPASYFSTEQTEIMRAHGLKVMDFYDYAEDFVSEGEPDFATFIAVHSIRRSYFLIEQKATWTDQDINIADLPAKYDEIEGIRWLPRILPKARGKLQGTLPPEIMYGCSGDRYFFKVLGLHPAEFLEVVWRAGSDDHKVVDYVKTRAAAFQAVNG